MQLLSGDAQEGVRNALQAILQPKVRADITRPKQTQGSPKDAVEGKNDSPQVPSDNEASTHREPT